MDGDDIGPHGLKKTVHFIVLATPAFSIGHSETLRNARGISRGSPVPGDFYPL